MSSSFGSRLLSPLYTGLAALLGLTLLAGSNLPVRASSTDLRGAATTLHLAREGDGANLMFVSLPGIGTAVMSLGSDGRPVFSPATLHKDELTFSMDGRQLNLSGIVLPAGTGSRATHTLIHLDRGSSRAPSTLAARPASSQVAAL